MKTRCLPWLLAPVFAASLDSAAIGGSLRKVWELDLTSEIKLTGAAEGLKAGILAIRFSPDGKKIAVASNPYNFGQPTMTRLIVVQASNPREHAEQFVVQHVVSDSERVAFGPPAISWSPDGKLVLAGLFLVRLMDGGTCEIPNSLGHAFLSPGRIVAEVLLGIGRSRIEFFDADCKSTGTWQPDYQDWTIRDVSPDRGFASMTGGRGPRKFEQDPSAQLLVLDPMTQRIVRSWSAAETGGESRFADHGRVLCGGDRGGGLYDNPKIPPRCVNVDTGEMIAEARGIVGGAPFSAAEHASRVVASDHKSTWNFLFGEYDTALTRRVVWDFRKNVEVASWKPETQTYSLLGPKLAKDPFAFAISPDGEYIAEGGNGILRLYKIEP